MLFTELSDSDQDLNLLETFYHGLYEEQFPDYNERESLQNMAAYLVLKRQGWYGSNNYHILLGREEGELVAACVCDYFHQANTGMIEFLLVSPKQRGKGLGKAMLDYTIQVFHDDARRAGFQQADFVMGEMNDPFLTDPADDNVDPFDRANVWGKWGFNVLDFPYQQPALDADKQAVGNLLLMARPLSNPAVLSVGSSVVRDVVYDYLKWAMRFSDPELNPEYRKMAEFLEARSQISLLPLQAYIGDATNRPISVLKVRDETTLQLMLPVYRANFAHKKDLAIDESEFAQLIGAPEVPWFRYHLWGLSAQPSGAVEGMASFFAFPWGGFGGYIALDGSLKQTKRLGLLLARIERQILRDYPSSKGWFIECDPPGVENEIFKKVGFKNLPIDYRQPDLESREGETGVDHLRKLNLLYKPFGRVYANALPSRQELQTAVADIFRAVYGIERPTETLAFRHLRFSEGM